MPDSCQCVSVVEEMDEAQYPIQFVARLTGLSAYVIRIWEQRYRVVAPQRTATKRRLYSQSEIERLCGRRAKRATVLGRSRSCPQTSWKSLERQHLRVKRNGPARRD